MRGFLTKMAGIGMLLVTVLLVEAFVLDGLSLLGAICLIPAAGLVALWLLQAGLRTPAKKRRRPVSRAAAATAPPQLVVYRGGGPRTPNGPRAA